MQKQLKKDNKYTKQSWQARSSVQLSSRKAEKRCSIGGITSIFAFIHYT
ncbi:hypothetical protein [Listeria rocourtiae]